MAKSHNFTKFSIKLTLEGNGIKAYFDVDGSKLDDHEDIVDYIAQQMRPHLQHLKQGETAALKAQIERLQAELANMQAKSAAVEKSVKNLKTSPRVITE